MNITDTYTWAREKHRDNNPLLPDNLRGLIIGKSNSGKTTLLLNLLLQPNWLDYNHLYLYGNSLHQKEYQILKRGFETGLSKEQLSNIFHQQDTLKKANISPIEAINEYSGTRAGGIKIELFENCEDIPDPKTLNPTHKNLLVLDDCYLGSQNKTASYYSRGRHNNCDVLYLSQNYFKLPRQSVRENSNIIILFKQDHRNLDHIYNDHIAGDMTRDEFKHFCKEVWSKKHNFVTIDLTSSKLDGKYRQNLDRFYFPECHSLI